MASCTSPRSDPLVRVTVTCTKGNCRPEPRTWTEVVPWYLAALPVLRIHVRHGSCAAIDYELEEV